MPRSPPISKTGLSRQRIARFLKRASDVFIRFNEGLSILKKVAAVGNGTIRLTVAAGEQAIRPTGQLPESLWLSNVLKGKAKKAAGDLWFIRIRRNWLCPRTFNHHRHSTSSISGRCLQDTQLREQATRDTYPHRIISTPFVGEPGTISYGDLSLHRSVRFRELRRESVLSYLACRLTRSLYPSAQAIPDTLRARSTPSFHTQNGRSVGRTRTYTRGMALPRAEIAFIEKSPDRIARCSDEHPLDDDDE